MSLSIFQRYCIGINIIAFLVFTIDFLIYNHGGDGIKPEFLADVVTLIGGALGTCIAFLVWDRKINKTNITWRVYASTLFIIQLVIFLVICGPRSNIFREYFINLYSNHIYLIWYLIIINIVTFIFFAVVKIKAIKGKWRIREIVLLGLSFIGGTIGGLVAMYICRHKIKSPQFKIGMPMILLAQIITMAYLKISGII